MCNNFLNKNLLSYLVLAEELEIERTRLKELGLTDEDIDGYFDFYWDLYFPTEGEN